MLRNHWRLTSQSLEIQECYDKDGFTPCGVSMHIVSTVQRTQSQRGCTECWQGGLAATCIEGHMGPECAVCKEELHYVDEATGVCEKCPNGAVSAIAVLAIICGVMLVVYLIRLFVYSPPPGLKAASAKFGRLLGAIERLGPSKVSPPRMPMQLHQHADCPRPCCSPATFTSPPASVYSCACLVLDQNGGDVLSDYHFP